MPHFEVSGVKSHRRPFGCSKTVAAIGFRIAGKRHAAHSAIEVTV